MIHGISTKGIDAWINSFHEMGLCKQELVNLQNELWVDKTHEYPKYP